MADNVTFQSSTLASPAANTLVSTEEVSTLNGGAVTAQHVQRIIAAIRTADGTAVDLPGDSSNGLDVDVTRVSGTVTISGAVTNAGTFAVQVSNTPTVTGTGGTFPVTDSGGSLTVDAPVATPVFVRLSDGSSAISTLPVSLASVPSHAVTNAGTFAVQVDGSALTALQLIDDVVFTDDAAFTPATSKGFAVGFQADETGTDSVDEGDFGVARMTLDRKQHTVAELESNAIRAGGTALTPKFAYLDTSSSGNQQIVAAVTSKKLRVLSYAISANGGVNVYFRSSTAGQISGTHYLTQYGGYARAFSPLGHFETTAGEALQINLSAGTAIGVTVQYIEV